MNVGQKTSRAHRKGSRKSSRCSLSPGEEIVSMDNINVKAPINNTALQQDTVVTVTQIVLPGMMSLQHFVDQIHAREKLFVQNLTLDASIRRFTVVTLMSLQIANSCTHVVKVSLSSASGAGIIRQVLSHHTAQEMRGGGKTWHTFIRRCTPL